MRGFRLRGGGEGDKAILRLSKCSKGIPPAGAKTIDVVGAEADDLSEGKGPGERRSPPGAGVSWKIDVGARRGLCTCSAPQGVLLVDADMYASLSQPFCVEGEASALVGVARRLNRGDAGDVLRECPMRVHGAVRRRAGQTSDRRSRANRQKERHVTAEKRAASGGEPHRRDRKQGTGDGAEENGDGAEESRLRRMKRLFPLRKRRQGNAAGSSGRT